MMHVTAELRAVMTWLLEHNHDGNDEQQRDAVYHWHGHWCQCKADCTCYT